MNSFPAPQDQLVTVPPEKSEPLLEYRPDVTAESPLSQDAEALARLDQHLKLKKSQTEFLKWLETQSWESAPERYAYKKIR